MSSELDFKHMQTLPELSPASTPKIRRKKPDVPDFRTAKSTAHMTLETFASESGFHSSSTILDKHKSRCQERVSQKKSLVMEIKQI